MSHLNLSLDFDRGVHHFRCECFCFFLAWSSFKVHACPRIALYRGNHSHDIWSLDSFLEIVLPNFWKSTPLSRILLLLLLRRVCRQEQIRKRGISKSTCRLAFILRWAIHAGLLCRFFEVKGRFLFMLNGDGFSRHENPFPFFHVPAWTAFVISWGSTPGVWIPDFS